jgi:hypothetical protein
VAVNVSVRPFSLRGQPLWTDYVVGDWMTRISHKGRAARHLRFAQWGTDGDGYRIGVWLDA